jgi:hypothetical protein
VVQRTQLDLITGATDAEEQMAQVMGAVMQSFARLAGCLGQGAWPHVREETTVMCEALAGLAALLPGDRDELVAYPCRPWQVEALLEAAGYPMSALHELGTGDYHAFAEQVRALVRHDLKTFGTITRSRDELLARSAHAGIPETEAAHLTSLSRNTVRKSLGK